MNRLNVIRVVMSTLLVGCAQEPLYLECQTMRLYGFNQRYTIDFSEKTVTEGRFRPQRLIVYENELIWNDESSRTKLDRFSLEMSKTIYGTGKEICEDELTEALAKFGDVGVCYVDHDTTTVRSCYAIDKKL